MPNAAGKVCLVKLRHLILEQASPETAEEVMQRNRWEGGREGRRARKQGSRSGRRQVEKPVVSEDVGSERERIPGTQTNERRGEEEVTGVKMRVEREEEEEQAGEGRGEEEFARTHTCRRTPTWLESEMTEVEDGQTVRKMRRRLGREESSRKDGGEETKVMRGGGRIGWMG